MKGDFLFSPHKGIVLVLLLLMGCGIGTAFAQVPIDSLDTETVSIVQDSTLTEPDMAVSVRDTALTLQAPAKKRSILTKTIDYFRNSDKRPSGKNFDFGILPGPHYSSTSGLGLGIVATGTYKTDRKDSLLIPSNVSLFGDMTTKGFLLIGLKGSNIFPKEKYQLDYKFYIYTFPTSFWGIGYENADKDSNETSYRRVKFEAMARFMFRIAPNTYLGPILNFQYVQAGSVKKEGEPLFAGQDKNLHTQTAGLSFTYDSRDFMLNASKGWFVQLDQTFTPRFLYNDYHFTTTDLTVCTYRQIWKGGILAGEFHTKLNYAGTPAWGMLSEVGTGSRMRGYYEGRYRDKDILEAQIELRQKIKGRHGFAVWAGAAEVFPQWDALCLNKVLPNAGLGYRWEFKKRINIRIDYGFTRNGGGFIFNINEAF